MLAYTETPWTTRSRIGKISIFRMDTNGYIHDFCWVEKRNLGRNRSRPSTFESYRDTTSIHFEGVLKSRKNLQGHVIQRKRTVLAKKGQ